MDAYYTQLIPRFTAGSGWRLTDMSVDTTRVAVSGYNNSTDTTFMDLFTLDVSDSTPLKEHQRPIFSREFPPVDDSIWPFRYVSLIDGDSSHIVTVCGSQLDLYYIHSNDDHCTVTYRDGEARCVAVSETGHIYIGLERSNEVIVFDGELNIIKSITLNGMKRCEWPADITVKNNNLFISTGWEHRALRYNMDGELLNRYNKPDQDSSVAVSITVSSEAGLVFVLWWWMSRRPVVSVFSLAGGHSLFTFVVDLVLPPLPRIRLSSKGNRLIVATREGELIVYNTLFSFENLKKHLCRSLSKNDFKELRKFYKIAEDEQTSLEGDGSNDRLLEILKKELISPDWTERLRDACKHLGETVTSELKKQLQAYQSHSERCKERLNQTEGSTFPNAGLNPVELLTRGTGMMESVMILDMTVSPDNEVLITCHKRHTKGIYVARILRNSSGKYVCSGSVNFIADVTDADVDDSDGTSDDRLISCIDKKRIVTCRGKKLIVFNHFDNDEEQSLTLDCKPSCMIVRGSDILVVYSSPSCLQLDVFESNLKKKCDIKLSDVRRSEEIIDVAVISGKVIVCTSKGVFLWKREEDKKILEYSPPKEMEASPVGIDVDEDYQMVAILWSYGFDETQLSFYSINCRFCLFVSDFEEEACQLRFVNSNNVALCSPDGNVSLHHISEFFTWDNFKMRFSSSVSVLIFGCDVHYLRKFFSVSYQEMDHCFDDDDDDDDDDDETQKQDQVNCILTVLEKNISPSQQIAALLEAADEVGKYHGHILWSTINIYQVFSSGSGLNTDIPYPSRRCSSYLPGPLKEVPIQRPTESQDVPQSSNHPGTSGTRPLTSVDLQQSEISPPFSSAQTSSSQEATKRSAPPPSGSNEDPVSKRKFTFLEHSSTAAARTMLQMALSSPQQAQLLPGRSNVDITQPQSHHHSSLPNVLSQQRPQFFFTPYSVGTLPLRNPMNIGQPQQRPQSVPRMFPSAGDLRFVGRQSLTPSSNRLPYSGGAQLMTPSITPQPTVQGVQNLLATPGNLEADYNLLQSMGSGFSSSHPSLVTNRTTQSSRIESVPQIHQNRTNHAQPPQQQHGHFMSVSQSQGTLSVGHTQPVQLLQRSSLVDNPQSEQNLTMSLDHRGQNLTTKGSTVQMARDFLDSLQRQLGKSTSHTSNERRNQREEASSQSAMVNRSRLMQISSNLTDEPRQMEMTSNTMDLTRNIQAPTTIGMASDEVQAPTTMNMASQVHAPTIMDTTSQMHVTTETQAPSVVMSVPSQQVPVLGTAMNVPSQTDLPSLSLMNVSRYIQESSLILDQSTSRQEMNSSELESANHDILHNPQNSLVEPSLEGGREISRNISAAVAEDSEVRFTNDAQQMSDQGTLPLLTSQQRRVKPTTSSETSETDELATEMGQYLIGLIKKNHEEILSLRRDLSQHLQPSQEDLSASGSSSTPASCRPSTSGHRVNVARSGDGAASCKAFNNLKDYEKETVLVHRNKTDDRVTLMKKLVPMIFTKEERISQNCHGKSNFEPFEKRKLKKLRDIIFYLCPVSSIEDTEKVEDKEWKKLCSEIDLFNRHYRLNLVRQKESKSKKTPSDKT